MVLARMQSGMMEVVNDADALKTVYPAVLVNHGQSGRKRGPILQVHDMCCGRGYFPHHPLVQGFVGGQVGIGWIDTFLDDVPEGLMLAESHADTHRLPKPLPVKFFLKVVVFKDRLLIGVGGGQAQFGPRRRPGICRQSCECPEVPIRLPPRLTPSVAKDCMEIFMSLRRSESWAV